MSARDYYNEFDPFAAEWLRQMIGLGVLPPGEVDGRSIKDVSPDDLKGFRHCHFFAGIGGWAYAMRLAEWPDDRPLWTGSCPCQPFSTAGRGRGHDDPRDLWPHFLRLIRARRPALVVGEQVTGKAGLGWLDRVSADLARQAYASRAVDIPACAVDTPNIRQRLYWVALADAERLGLGGRAGEPGGYVLDGSATGRAEGPGRAAERDAARALVDASGDGWREGRTERAVRGRGPSPADPDAPRDLADAGRELRRAGPGSPRDGAVGADVHGAGDMAHADVAVLRGLSPARQFAIDEQDPRTRLWAGPGNDDGRAARRNWRSAWASAVWIACHDGKARRAEPGVPLLAYGVPARVPKWRGFGNAINPVLAAEVLGALLDVLPGRAAAGRACE